MSQGRFRLDVNVPALALDRVRTSEHLAALGSDDAYVNFRVSLPTSELAGLEAPSPYGSFVADSRSTKYNMLWGSRRDFELFLSQEMSLHSVEFLKTQTTRGLSGKYLERECYSCARHGRPVDYVKKNPHWGRKVPSKVTHCTASLTVKSYVETLYLLGIYDSEHNHPLGNENLRFTRISPATRDWIAGMVRMKVKTDHIVRTVVSLCHLFM